MDESELRVQLALLRRQYRELLEETKEERQERERIEEENQRLFKFEWSVLEARVRGLVTEQMTTFEKWRHRTDSHLKETDQKHENIVQSLEMLNQVVFWKKYKNQPSKYVFHEILEQVTEIRAKVEEHFTETSQRIESVARLESNWSAELAQMTQRLNQQDESLA